MKRFLALCLVALCLLAVVLYFVDSHLRTQALASADSALAERAHSLADMVDRTLQWRMTEVFTFAALPSMRGFAASDETARPGRAAVALVELKAILAADPNIRAVSIVDPLGEIILTTDASMGVNWSERMFVREALVGHLYASVPARDFGEVSQYYGAPVLDNAGNVAGALVVRVAVQELWGALGGQPNVVLIDDNGVRLADQSAAPQDFVALVPIAPNVAASLLAEKRYGAEVTQIPATNLVALADAIKRSGAAVLTYRDANGQTLRAATRRLTTYPWSVVVFQSEDAILSLERAAFWGAIAFGAAGLIAGAALSIALRGFGRRD